MTDDLKYSREFWDAARKLLDTGHVVCGQCGRGRGAGIYRRGRVVRTKAGERTVPGKFIKHLNVRPVLLDRNERNLTPANLAVRCVECFPDTAEKPVEKPGKKAKGVQREPKDSKAAGDSGGRANLFSRGG